MKTKIVLWGTKGEEEATEKVLLAFELNPNANKVTSWVFEGESASEEFSKALLNQWTKGEAVAFPEGTESQEVTLSASTSLLPEGISIEKKELLTRTQTEWIFIVLSTKLYQNYQAELEELQEKVDGLKAYSKGMWEEMKSFWSKVQKQVSEQNLFREHTNTLRSRTNELFGQLKKMRSAEDSLFEAEAMGNFEKLAAKLEGLENKILGESSDLHKLFEQLKSLQRDFKDAKLTRSLRSKLWERIDAAFKKVKTKRSPNSSPEGRLTRLIDGLKGAIGKMEKSIGRDKRDLASQNDRINSGDVSQLETQLREVRAKLIQERIDSKSKKLEDMQKTLADLEVREAKNLARKAKEQAAAEKKEKEKQKAAAKKAEEEAKAKEEEKTPKAEEKEVVEEAKAKEEEETPKAEEKEVVEEVKVKEEVEAPKAEEKEAKDEEE